MPITYTDNGGGAANGSDLEFTFTFPVLQTEDVKVALNGVTQATTKYAVDTASNPTKITFNNTSIDSSVQETSGAPKSGVRVRVYRETTVGKASGDDDPKAVFAAGSSIRATDLNANVEQALYAIHELQTRPIETEDIQDDAVTHAKVADDAIHTEQIMDGQVDAIKLNQASGSEAVVTNAIRDDAVTTAKIAANAVTATEIANNAVTSTKIAANAITTTEILNGGVTRAKLEADIIDGTKLADNAVDSEHYTDGSIDRVHLEADIIDSTKLADNAVNSEHYVDGSIDRVHLSADIIDSTKLADNAVGTEHIQADAVTMAKLGSGALPTDITVASANIVDGTIVSGDIANDAVTTNKIADSELKTLAGMQSATASNLASSTALTATTAELNQLDGITLETTLTGTSDTRIPTSKAVNDQILAVTNALGGFVAIADETSFPATNPDPSNGAGTVVSISQVSSASAITINNNGVATIANGAGTGNTVTITGFPTTLRNTSLAASSGLQVQTTTTLHTYTFHKQLASAADIAAISATVNSFSNRYRVSSSAPTSSLDGGDLWYDTTNSKLMVYSSQNSAWEESSAIGNFFISTISSSSSTGGGSATANGTAYRFTISNAPPDAQQLLVSVDGVIQKPNAGSSQPSEGYVLVGNDIIFGSAPANGASIFVTVIGSTVGIGTPSNNTVTSAILQNGSVTTSKIVDANVTTAKITDANVTTAKIADSAVTTAKIAANAVTSAKLANNSVGTSALATGAVTTSTLASDAVTSAKIADGTIVNADINASAAIAGTKISPDFGSQNITTSGEIEITGSNTVIKFTENDANPDFGFLGNGGLLRVQDLTNTANIMVFGPNNVQCIKNLDLDNGLDVSGNITVTGTVDGVDIAALNTTVSNITTDVVSDTSPQLGGNLDTNSFEINLDDGHAVRFGDSYELQVFHGSDGVSRIESNGGGFHIRQINNGDVHIHAGANTGSSNNRLVARASGAAELHHSGSKKLETLSTGIDVTGACNCDTINVNSSLSQNGKLAVKMDSNKHIAFSSTQSEVGNVPALVAFQDSGSLQSIGFRGVDIRFAAGSSERWRIDSSGNLRPSANNNVDIGTSSYRVRNIYTNDLHLSNKGHSNDVDGSWGDWTIQEGESDLFLKNNRSGKKYKFNLTEVS